MNDSRAWVKRLGIGIGGLVALALLVSALILLLRILWAPTEIGTPATESDALIRANERMLDMTKWTISTILLIGGGLIGLNWYSNEHRYREDKTQRTEQIDSIEKARLSDLKSNIEMIVPLQSQLYEVRFDVRRVVDQLSTIMLMPDGQMPLGGYVAATLEHIRKPGTNDLFKERAIAHIATMFEREGSASPFMAFLGLNDIPELAREAENQGFPELAARLRKRHHELLGEAGKVKE